MANPQIENGHIDIANEIVDKFCSYRLSGQEWQIIWVVLRKTWGWLENPKNKAGPKKKMDRISESQFAELTGIDRRKCHTLLKKLVGSRVLKRTATHKEGKTKITYGFQKDFDKWKLPPIKRAATHKEGTLPPIKRARLPPIKMHTKETLKETITKESTSSAFFQNAGQNEEQDDVFYLTKNNKKLSGMRLITFERFWDAFGYKRGKAAAADAWLSIPQLTKNIVNKIITSAITEAMRRPQVISSGNTPIMAQGWLSGRRWEDDCGKELQAAEKQPRPNTYGQAKDAEQRNMAKWLLNEEKRKREES